MLKSDKVNHVSLAAKATNSSKTKFFSSDMWTAEELGLKICPGNSENKLYFHQIEQIWLKDLSKNKKEIQVYHSKVVNICGQVIESSFPELDNNTELQWMKKQILGEVLAHGYCILPAHLDCSKGNACLQCGDFRTTREFLDKHKEHRERTHEALEVATINNWKRQVQVHEEVMSNLNKIINELEKC